MRLRNTLLTGAASYIQVGTVILTQLAAIPLALHYLDTERFGLWSFISQSLGYLMLLDFGVSNSIGRLLVEPLHNGDEQTWNGWVNMILAVLTIQGSLVLVVGFLIVDVILHWFNIPPWLLTEARHLWLMTLVVSAINFPFRLLSGILNAQNRYHYYFFSIALSTAAWLGVFFICLKSGLGSMAYVISIVAQTIISVSLLLTAIAKGPNRFKISMRNIPWQHTRELFGFSSAVFVCAVATQVAFMSQSLIITKILGLGAVAGFTVCSKVPMQLMQLIWRPFDAFGVRWQVFWAKNEKDSLAVEFSKILRVTIGLAMLAMACSLSLNRWFVYIFGKQALYQGKTFDFFFTLFVLAQVWTHCLSFPFVQAKKMKGYAAIVALDTVLGIAFAIFGTKWFGLNGYIAFTSIYALAGLAFWYITLKGPRLFGVNSAQLLRKSATVFAAFSLLLGGSLLLFHQVDEYSASTVLTTEIGVVVVAFGLFLGIFHRDIQAAYNYFYQAMHKRRSCQSESVSIS